MAYQTGCTAPPWGFLQTPATAKMGTERTTHLITEKVFPEVQVLSLTCTTLYSQEGAPFEPSYIFLICKTGIKMGHAPFSQDRMR